MSEKQLADIIFKDWQREPGETEPEVRVPLDGRNVSIDLVRDTPNTLYVCECKQELSDKLFSQCRRWIPFADFIYAAVWAPFNMGWKDKRLVGLCKRWYIGVLLVTRGGTIQVHQKAHRQSNPDRRLIREGLCGSSCKKPAPGSAAAKRPKPGPWREVRDFLEISGPAPIKSLVSAGILKNATEGVRLVTAIERSKDEAWGFKLLTPLKSAPAIIAHADWNGEYE